METEESAFEAIRNRVSTQEDENEYEDKREMNLGKRTTSK
jgi:hypothetical protein